MEAQDFVGCFIKDELYQPLVLPHGQGFAVAREIEHAGAHVPACGPGLLLGEAHHGRFRIAVDAGGDAVQIQLLAGLSGDVVGSQQALGGGYMGQLHLAVDVADGVHAGDIGPAEAVDLHKALPVHLYAEGFQADAPGVGNPASGHEDHVALRRALGPVLDGGVIHLQAGLDGFHFDAQDQLHAVLFQLGLHKVRDILVQGSQHPVQHLHHGDLHAQAVIEGGELNADDPAAHDDDVFGAGGHVQEARGIHHAGEVHAGNGNPGGAGAGGHDQVSALQSLAIVQFHSGPGGEGGVGPDDGNAVALFQEADAVAQLLRDGVFPLDDFRVIEGHVPGGDAESGPVFRLVVHAGGVEEGLGGDAAPVQAGAAQLRLLHQGGVQAVLGQADGALIAAGAAAHDDRVEFLHMSALLK